MTLRVLIPSVLLTLLLTSIGSPAGADTSNWQWQNPLPQGNTLWDVDFVGEDIGYAVGAGETIVATHDGGETWELRSVGSTFVDFTAIQMMDPRTGWLLAQAQANGATSEILHSTDGWSSRTSVFETSAAIQAMQWLDEDTGYVAAGQELLRTLDGGGSWESIFKAESLGALFVLDENHLWCSSGATVHRTSNGGTSWESARVQNHGELLQIQFVTPAHGWAVTQEWGPNYLAGIIYVTHDGGGTWCEQLSRGGSFWYAYFPDFQMVDRQTGWAAASDHTLLRTLDGGDTWSEVGTIWGRLEFLDARMGWTVGAWGRIQRTDDAGGLWYDQHFGYTESTSDWPDLQFLDDHVGFASLDRSLLATIDGGGSWQRLVVDPTPGQYGHLRSCFFRSSRRGWLTWEMGGGWGKILSTEDGGRTFTVQAEDILRCFDITFVNDDTGWAVGSRMYKTTDGGEHWVEQPPLASLELDTVVFLDEQTGWVAGVGSNTFRTTDGGETWETSDLGQPVYVRQLMFQDAQVGFAVGWYNFDGLVFRTIDGGESWERVLTAVDVRFMDGMVRDSLVQVVGIGRGGLWYSPDLGDSWQRREDVPLASGVRQIASSGPAATWLLGSGGAIVREIPHLTAVGPASPEMRLLPNRPNPFSLGTFVEYSVGSAVAVELSIFDVRGRRVRTLFEGSRVPGRYEVFWDGRDAWGRRTSCGTYLCRLRTGTAVSTRKMTLLR